MDSKNSINNSALLTDLYQLTMAQSFFENNNDSLNACFHLFFRDYPFKGGYAISCGQAQIVDFVKNYTFTKDDIKYLKSLKFGGDSHLSKEFIEYLSHLKLSVNIDAVPEGSVVFPNEPVLRITGPIFECQLLETALLNIFNFQTLIATKASRICQAAQCDVAEFGLRRAQGPCGGIYASRAACIGGCSSTSNVCAGSVFNLPVSGTHSHSWVQSFDCELESFRAYSRVFPDNCVLLVDTYDINQGIKNAITVGLEMKARGQHLTAIRIDSGDLSWLSKIARKELDHAGLNDTGIILSNDLDEYSIKSIKSEGACFTGLGVGTKLTTGYDQPTLGGVFKLGAIKNTSNNKMDVHWTPKIKVSESLGKITIPGVLGVRRYFDKNNKLSGDMIYDINDGVDKSSIIVDPNDGLRRKHLNPYNQNSKTKSYIDLLEPIIVNGQARDVDYSWEVAKRRAIDGLSQLDETQKRILNPHTYPVGLEYSLFNKRRAMISNIKGISD